MGGWFVFRHDQGQWRRQVAEGVCLKGYSGSFIKKRNVTLTIFDTGSSICNFVILHAKQIYICNAKCNDDRHGITVFKKQLIKAC